MSWTDIARTDFENAVKSKLAWSTVGLFVVFAAIFVLVEWNAGGASHRAVAMLVAPAEILIPVTALVVSYRAIAGERESGSLRLVLGYPYSRRDFLVGKLVGRSAVVVVSVLCAAVVAGIMLLALYGSLPVGDLVWWTISTMLLAVGFVGLTLGISAAVSTRLRSMTAALGVFFVFHLFWQIFADVAHLLVQGELPGSDELPAWFVFMRHLSPGISYQRITDFGLSSNVGSGLIQSSAEEAGNPNLVSRVSGEAPFYLDDWFAWVILLAWAVIPLAIGYIRFQRADLK